MAEQCPQGMLCGRQVESLSRCCSQKNSDLPGPETPSSPPLSSQKRKPRPRDSRRTTRGVPASGRTTPQIPVSRLSAPGFQTMPRSPLPTSAGRLPVLAQGSRGTAAQRGKEHKRGSDSSTGTGLMLPQDSEAFRWPRDHSQDFWQVYSTSRIKAASPPWTHPQCRTIPRGKENDRMITKPGQLSRPPLGPQGDTCRTSLSCGLDFDTVGDCCYQSPKGCKPNKTRRMNQPSQGNLRIFKTGTPERRRG